MNPGRLGEKAPSHLLPSEQLRCLLLAKLLQTLTSQYSLLSFKIPLNDNLFKYQHQLASNSMNKCFSACLQVPPLLFVPKYLAGTSYINKETSIFNSHMRCKSFRWIFFFFFCQQSGRLEEQLLTATGDTQAGPGDRAPDLAWIKETLQAPDLSAS